MGKKIDMRAETLCANVDPAIKNQVITLTNAILAMQKKIEQQIPIYDQLPLAQTVRVGTGEKMLRSNPAVEEFRSTVRDYANILSKLQEILGDNASPATISSLDDMRSKIRMIQ